jgi:hypothetical protein
MNKLTAVIATFVPGILSTMAFVRSNSDNTFPQQRRLSGCSIFGDMIEED